MSARKHARSSRPKRSRGFRLEIQAITASSLLVARRVRRDLAALVALVMLVALTSVLAVGVPSHIEATLNGGAREAVAAAGQDTDLLLRTPVADISGFGTATAERVIAFGGEVPDRLPDTLAAVARETSTGLLGPELRAKGPASTVLVRIAVLDPAAAPGVILADGALPTADSAAPGEPTRLGIAVSTEAASAAGLAVGDTLTVPTASIDDTIVLEVIGIVDAVNPSAQSWVDLPGLWDPVVSPSSGAGTGASFTALSDAAGFDRVATYFPDVSNAIIRTSFNPSAFDLQRFTAVGDSIDELETSASTLSEGSPIGVAATSGYEKAMSGFPVAAAAASAQLSTLAAGLLGVALLVTVLSGTALAARRRPEVELLRSRGASVGLVTVHAAVESVVVTLVGAGLGIAVALALGFDISSVLLLVIAAGTAAAAPVVSTLLQAVAVSPARLATVRIAGAAVLIALSITAVVALRSGTGMGGVWIDPLTLAAPVLCAGVIAIAVSPLISWVTRSVSSLGSRLRGAGAVLAGSSARDGRSIVTLVALILASSVAITSLVLFHSVAAGQETESYRAVGGDVRIDGTSDAESLVRRFEDAGATAAAIAVLDGVKVQGTSSSAAVTLLAVDDDYGRLLTETPARQQQGQNAEAASRLLEQKSPGTAEQAMAPVPILLDSRAARAAGEYGASLDFGGTLVPVVAVGSTIDTPGFLGGPVVVVDRSRLAAYLDAAVVGRPGGFARPDLDPTTVLAVGDSAGSVAAGAGTAGAVVDRADSLARSRDGALVAGVAAATVQSLLGTAILAMLALIVTTFIGARRRGRTLALLTALGLPKRFGVALALGELAPLVVGSIVGGSIAAAVVLAVAGPAFGADILAGGSVVYVLPPWLALSIVGVAAAALAVAVLVDIPLSRRITTSDILRTGEES
ncbi:MAG: hypothetical protein JWQ43_3093 [Glaciihabitans sp.]|nr:hypothetical protein [Glaciihabitans sp.]